MKWFLTLEVHSVLARRLLNDEQVSIIAPDLLGIEIANALAMKRRRGDMTNEEVDSFLDTFAGLALEIHPSRNLLRRATQLSAFLNRTVYDSLYLALAITQNCALITADRKFYDAVAASELAPHIRWIEDAG